MEKETINVLLVEDNVDHAELIRQAFALHSTPTKQFNITVAVNLVKARKALSGLSPDLIIADLMLPDGQGTTLLPGPRERATTPIIMMTSHRDEQIAVEAIKAGALDYVIKSGTNWTEIPRVAERALREWQHMVERVQAERQAHERQTYLQKVLDSVPDAIVTLDPQHRVVEWNPGAQQLFGYTPEQAIGHDLDHLITTPESFETAVQLTQAALQGETVGPMETVRYRQDGTPVNVILAGSPIFLEDELIGLVSVYTDITEQVKAQQREKRFLKQQVAVNQLALALEEPRDLDKIYRTMYEHIRTLMSTEAFIVSFYDHEKRQIRAGYVVSEDTILDVTGFPPIPLEEPGHGTQSWVIRSGEPLYIPDWRQAMAKTETEYKVAPDGAVSPGAPPADEQPQSTNSGLLVPMKVEGQTMGVVQVQSHQLDAYTQEDLDLLVALTNVAAIAIQNAQLYQELHDRATRQEALNAIIAAAVTAPELSDLVETALTHTLQALEAQRGAIWLPNYSATRGISSDCRVTISQAFEATDLDVSQPLVVEDWTQLPDDAPWTPLSSMMTRFEIQASLVTPILVQGQRIGGFGIGVDQPRTWTAEEVALLEAAGQQIGAAAQRLRLLAQTQHQAQQMQDLLDAVPEGVVLLDTEGHILLQNPTARQLLSVLTDVTDGAPVTHLGPQSLSGVLERHTETLPVEITLSSNRIFEVQARPIDVKETRQWVLALREVTQEREIQRQMQSQERLVTVGQLAAGIAHDFNNIMSSVVLYASMLLRSSNLSPKEKQRVDTIRQQGHRAAHLVQQILDFARKAVMEQQPLDLLPFLKELEKLLVRTLPENIKLHIHYGHDSYMVNADPTRIQQVVINLALNARDAMPQGGQLDFVLSCLTIAPDDTPPLRDLSPGEWIRLSVTDTGTGIPPDVLPHIFEPFFTTKQVGKGTGLGLAQVYGIVGAHGGHIDVDSQVGHGTTFAVYLPALSITDDTPQSEQASDLVWGKGQKIMVVEDDVATRQALCDILEDLGYQVLTAHNGKEAQTLMQQHGHQIALVLSDLVMPKVGGAELYASLQAQYPHTKMIMITGYPAANQDKALLEQGITAWLQKPFSADDIARIVAQALA